MKSWKIKMENEKNAKNEKWKMKSKELTMKNEKWKKQNKNEKQKT